MGTKIISNNVEIHVTPLEEIKILDHTIQITFDDIHEQRWRITFKPFQAVKVTTIDCLSAEEYFAEGSYDNQGIYHRYLLEVIKSSWLEALRNKNKKGQTGFLERSHHYVLPFQENVVEIIAWENYMLEKLD